LKKDSRPSGNTGSSERMNVFEKSECFRAFLLLIGKDRVIAEEERMSMMAIGKKLDFEPRFCTNAINDLLENRHISIDPPRFRSRKLVESLLRDGFSTRLLLFKRWKIPLL
jgi:hypothetical protein